MTNVVLWADKGGVGKTTNATSLAVGLGAELVDLDAQGDATRWAEMRGITVASPRGLELQELLLAPGLRVVDCPPGQGKEALVAVALADLLIIPARTGNADMVALGRALDVARRVRSARPALQVGITLNLARETGRAKGVEAALKAQSGADYHWLGRLSARVGVEEAYASGKTLLQAGGAVAHEFREILQAVEVLVSSENLVEASSASVN